MARRLPAFVGQLKCDRFLQLRCAANRRANITELVLNVGPFSPRCEIGEFVCVGDFRLADGLVAGGLGPFDDGVDGLHSVAESGRLRQGSLCLPEITLTISGGFVTPDMLASGPTKNARDIGFGVHGLHQSGILQDGHLGSDAEGELLLGRGYIDRKRLPKPGAGPPSTLKVSVNGVFEVRFTWLPIISAAPDQQKPDDN